MDYIIFVRDGSTSRSLSSEIVEGIGKVLQLRQLANTRQYDAGEFVVGDVELLQALHVFANGGGKRTLKLVEAHVQDGEIGEEADQGRQAAGEVVIEEDDLVEGLGHLSNAGGDATAEFVVGQHQHRNRGVAEIVGDAESEPVVVEENSVEILVEELGGDGAFELVEAEIQVLEGR